MYDDFAMFEEELNKIKLILPPCEITNAILVVLPSGKNIPPHTDTGLFFDLYSRIHIPIITNPKCLFTVDGETIHMKAGELWEINNHKKHSVENNGEEDRIHLIIDCDFE
jgi:aspartyl/asparaginyl beta-hydroxylase (cupin superfamily)